MGTAEEDDDGLAPTLEACLQWSLGEIGLATELVSDIGTKSSSEGKVRLQPLLLMIEEVYHLRPPATQESCSSGHAQTSDFPSSTLSNFLSSGMLAPSYCPRNEHVKQQRYSAAGGCGAT
ncbi:hypothetical protein B0F90DRAFT_1671494 [Multifurca ochricompacta]|uniref:Uncharacterized protein n=1 Tax=Multifurca ochricompacta TaxID=376703 RepID=A0AAD4QJ93_9AGAM|nr:hypothetical protein B0F90DRAFT_1671494 [Multifurca ochricompacta]